MSNEAVHFPSEVWPSLCFVNALHNLRIFYALFYASVKGDLRIFYASINACRLVLRNKTRTLTHAPIRVVRMRAPYCAKVLASKGSHRVLQDYIILAGAVKYTTFSNYICYYDSSKTENRLL